MSRIFDALRNAQAIRDKNANSKDQGNEGVEVPDRRGSRRLAIDIPVYVYGHTAGEETFYEEAHTLQVSANGALVLLGGRVQPGDKILLTHTISQKEQNCTVVHIGKRYQQCVEVGVSFTEPNPQFWQLRFENVSKAATP